MQRYLLILAMGLFALSAFDYAEQGKTVMTTVMAIVAALNLLAFLLSRYFGPYPGAILNLANALVAALVAVDLFRSGKQYLPYIWLVAAAFYVIATIVGLVKAWRQKPQ
ncbi:hypothetical protein BH09BAC1_BH09BAC1_01080 [soil metagenome]